MSPEKVHREEILKFWKTIFPYIIGFVGSIAASLTIAQRLGAEKGTLLLVAVIISFIGIFVFTWFVMEKLVIILFREEVKRESYKITNLNKRYGIFSAEEDWHTDAYQHFDFPSTEIIPKTKLEKIDKSKIDVLIIPYQSISYLSEKFRHELKDKIRLFQNQGGFIVSFESYLFDILDDVIVEPCHTERLIPKKNNHIIFRQPYNFNPRVFNIHHGIISKFSDTHCEILAIDNKDNPIIIVSSKFFVTTVDADYHYLKDQDLKKANEAGKLLSNIISYVDKLPVSYP